MALPEQVAVAAVEVGQVALPVAVLKTLTVQQVELMAAAAEHLTAVMAEQVA